MKGYVHVYTGDGKGKTTAAYGLALRAAGAGLRVFIARFIKGKPYSEDPALEKFKKRITVRRYGRGCFVRGAPKAADVAAVMRGIAECAAVIESGRYDLVILDEAAVAAHLKLCRAADLLKLIDVRPANVELVFTGRRAPGALLRRADLVTEMREKKHYYRRGVKARKGIEK